MLTVDQMISNILRREGGFVDDPVDRGGATNHGISLRYARGIRLDLDGDGDTDVDDIRAVSAEIAADLYRRDFFVGPGIDRLPPALQPLLFDWAVNSGPRRAVRALQTVLNRVRGAQRERFGFTPLSTDGLIGPRTIAATEAVLAELGPVLVNMLVESREAFYRAIVARDASQSRFLRGWLAHRVEPFRVTALA